MNSQNAKTENESDGLNNDSNHEAECAPHDLAASTSYSRPARRSRGKVARLPLPVRQTVNLMLADGEPYSAIIHRLDVLGYPGFTAHNVSRWKLGGHQSWLDAQEKFDLEKLRVESSAEEVKHFKDPAAVEDASEMLAALNTFRALRELESRPPNELLDDPSHTFFRLARIINRQTAERTRRERVQSRKKFTETDFINQLVADPKKLERILNQIRARYSPPESVAANRS